MSKGSKRNKGSDFEASGNDSDDDFEKDFKNKKNKKTKGEPGSEKKLRDRRSAKENMFEREMKKAIELSLKEAPKAEDENPVKAQLDLVDEDEDDFIKKPKKSEPKDSLKSNESLDVREEPHVEDKETAEVVEIVESKVEEKIVEPENSAKKPAKKTPPKNTKKKSKKIESDDDEEDYEDEDSGDDFKKSKSKKKTPPAKKKTSPSGSGKKGKNAKKIDEASQPLVEKDMNTVKEPVFSKVSLKFDEPCDETKIIVPKLTSSSSSSSRKSFSSVESVKPEKKNNLNSSLNLNTAPSPLGRIEIKTAQPQYRVGLSRNSKVKPLHPNVKLA